MGKGELGLKSRGVVGSKGRITIPKSVRESLKITEGTFFEMEPHGSDKALITFWVTKNE